MLVSRRTAVLLIGIIVAACFISVSEADKNCSQINSPPSGKCEVILGDDIEWIEVGEKNAPPLDLIKGLFDSIYVDIEAAGTRNIQVFWHGGTPWEPELMQGFSRKYCGHWYDPVMWVRNHNQCSFRVSRFGPWAPLGHMKLAVKEKLAFMERPRAEPLQYTIRYYTDFDASMPIWLAVGLVIWWIAPRIGRSRIIHISTGTVLGGVAGALVVLFVLSRILPANRRSAFLAASFSAVGMSMTWLWDSLRAFLEEYMMWVILCLAVGAFAGFAISYKFKLDSTSQDLVIVVLRLIAIAFILSGTNNGFASVGIVLLLILREIYNYIHAWMRPEEAIPEWHEQRGYSQEGPLRYTHEGPVENWYTPPAPPTTPHRTYSNGVPSSADMRHRSRSRSRSVSRASMPVVTGVRSTPSYSSRTMPSSATPSRFATYKLMNERMGADKASRFTVNGVGDYISVDEFERQQRLTTELELLKLRERLRQGGDYVNVLSPDAQRAVSRWIGEEPLSPNGSDNGD